MQRPQDVVVVGAERVPRGIGRRRVPVFDLPRASGAGPGARGAAPADTAALEDLLLRLGRLAEDLPEIAELDLNPVLAGPGGCTAVDVKLRLAAPGPEPEPYGRQLLRREPTGLMPR